MSTDSGVGPYAAVTRSSLKAATATQAELLQAVDSI